MQDKHAQLQPDCLYHVYNRANGSELMFLSDENYRFFLRQFSKYIAPIAETYCYCLMPNHFHFLIKIRDEESILDLINLRSSNATKTLQGFETLEGLAKSNVISKYLTQQFSHLFNTYTQAFNKQHHRKGSLFMHPYKRKQITSPQYLTNLIHYIHYNPVEANLARHCADWKYSSYSAIISNKPTSIEKSEVIEIFDDLQNFKYLHQIEPYSDEQFDF